MSDFDLASGPISHIGIAVRDLEEAVARYARLTGCDNPTIHTVEEQKVRVAIFDFDQSAGGRIELVAASSDDSPVARFVAKRGEGLHHLCIYVDDLETKLSELKQAGLRLIDETPRIGAEGRPIAFVHPDSCNGVLIELEQRDQK